MKFSIAKETILDGLQQVQSVISTRTTLPILQNVLIEAKHGALVLSTTDLDVGISASVDAEVEEQGATTLPARRLFSICRELPAADASIEVDSRNVATLKSGNALFKILGLAREEFPPMAPIEKAKALKLPQQLLRDMLRKTSYAISHDETRYVLNGILMSFKERKLTMVATDGRRLALADTEVELAPSQEADIILPTKAVNELQRLLKDEGDVTLNMTESRCSFDLGRARLMSKLTEGNYPNYRQVIPAETKERVSLERETFLTTIRRVALLTSEKSSSVKLSFSKDAATLSANSPDVGEARESIAVKYRGKDFTAAFNPEYLMDPLRNLADDEVHFDFVDDTSPGVIRVSSSSFLYVIMPMRMA